MALNDLSEFDMTRLFVALDVPESVRNALSTLQSGVEGARWRPIENFHLTLAFIGDTDRHGFNDACTALAGIEVPGFDLSLTGIGHFGERKPRALWVGVSPAPALLHLQSKIEIALRRSGFDLENRKFTPHVTLAYLKGTRRDVVQSYCAANGMFKAGPFSVDKFHLYSSTLGGEGSHYRIEASYAFSSSM